MDDVEQGPLSGLLDPGRYGTWLGQGADAELLLYADDSARREVVLQLTARFAHFEHAWEQRVELEPGADATLRLDLPPEAFLHPEAERYLTDIQVLAEIDGRPVDFGYVHVLWSDGAALPPRVWTASQASAELPQGTSDETALQAAFDIGYEGRLLPPVFKSTARPRRTWRALSTTALDTGLEEAP